MSKTDEYRHIDQGMELRRAKASEMAGEEIVWVTH